MEWAAGNVFIRPFTLHKGEVILGHAHNFDHVSICLRGAVRIDAGQIARELHAPSNDIAVDRAHVLIKAGVEHEITGLEENSLCWCVYAHRTPQGEVVQEFTGWGPAYN